MTPAVSAGPAARDVVLDTHSCCGWSPPPRPSLHTLAMSWVSEVARFGCRRRRPGKSPSKPGSAASTASPYCRRGRTSSPTWRPPNFRSTPQTRSLPGACLWEHRDPFDRMLVAQATRTQPHHRHPRRTNTPRCPHPDSESLIKTSVASLRRKQSRSSRRFEGRWRTVPAPAQAGGE